MTTTVLFILAIALISVLWFCLDAATERVDAAEYDAIMLREQVRAYGEIIRKQDCQIAESLNLIATLRDENRAQRIYERERDVYYYEN